MAAPATEQMDPPLPDQIGKRHQSRRRGYNVTLSACLDIIGCGRVHGAEPRIPRQQPRSARIRAPNGAVRHLRRGFGCSAGLRSRLRNRFIRWLTAARMGE